MNRFHAKGAWQAIYIPWGRKESDMTKQLTHTQLFAICINFKNYKVKG